MQIIYIPVFGCAVFAGIEVGLRPVDRRWSSQRFWFSSLYTYTQATTAYEKFECLDPMMDEITAAVKSIAKVKRTATAEEVRLQTSVEEG